LNSRLVDSDYWVGDLMLECRAKIDDPAAKLVLELSKGVNRYQAEFTGGEVKLIRTGPGGGVLCTRPTPMTTAGVYDLRVANFDSCLRVWINGTPIDFGTEADYAPALPPEKFEPGDQLHEGWNKSNDVLEPASIGVSGNITISSIRLWRDTYYVQAIGDTRNMNRPRSDLSTYYVQPGHSLCLGDNSSHSGDSRMWGLVPDRLMLGRAVFVFYTFSRFGFIK
jgi:signal peptidase I